MKNKRIAFISDHASPLATIGGIDSGGQNIYVAQLAIHLQQLGYKIDIYTRKTDIKQKTVHSWLPDIRVIHVPAGPSAEIPKEALWPYMPSFAAFMQKFIKDNQISYILVHAHFWMSGWIAIQLKKLLGIPFIITFHALGKVRLRHQKNKDKFPEERVQIEKEIVQQADQIIAECPQDGADLFSLYNASTENTSLVPCGFNPNEFKPIGSALAREALNLPQNVPILLQLGRMVPRKGIDNVIRALKYLKTRYNGAYEKALLLVVGGHFKEVSNASPRPDKEEWLRLTDLTKRYNLENQVLFYGAKTRDQLRLFYAATDIFVSTPWYEPFGITPLEAMACARPVIGSGVGGLKFTIKEGETGLLVPPKKPILLARDLHYLFSHPQLMQKMGQNGLSRVHKYFTWEKVAVKMDSIYHKISRVANIQTQSAQDKTRTFYTLNILKNG